ncbi:MAG: hypothetical protein QQN41_06595 [Nitrosopumilus sp.]
MDLIYQNPFRILGLSVTATDREIAKRIGDMSIYADMGKPIEYDCDHFFPVKPVRTTESIEEAKQKIDQPNNKLFYALFWFWENSNNIIDEMAFEELRNGNIEKAIQFWKKEIEKGITSQNKSNYKNLFTLRLGLSVKNGKLNKNHFLKSLSLSGKFLANGHFEEFINQVLGVRHSVDIMEIINHFIDEIISMVKPHIDSRKSENKVTHKELLHHFGTYPESIQNDILDKFIGKHIHNIERQIEKTEQFRRDDVSIANKSGFELYKNTKDDLKQLQSVLSKTDLKYQLIVDKLADELISSSIAYFNEYRDTDIDPGDDALKLAKYAKKIAVSDKVKDRIEDGIPILQEYVDEKPIRSIIEPLIENLNHFQNKAENANDRESYEIAKEFVFGIKNYLDDLRDILKRDEYESNYEYIKNLLAACAVFVNGCGVDIANENSQYGLAIELVDMARRILLYESSNGETYTINEELSYGLERGRETLSNNISNQELGLTSLLFGGGIRMAKKRIACGCGSGKSLKECCSI